MRVCIINEFFYPDNTGGTGTVLSNLARCLRYNYGDDLEIEVITTRNLYRDNQFKIPAHEVWNGITIHRLNSPRSDKKSTLRRLIANIHFTFVALAKLLFMRRYDLLVVASAPPTLPLAAYLNKLFTGTPFNYIVYDLEPDRAVALKAFSAESIPARILGWWQKRWLHAAARVIVPGRCMRDYLVKHYALDSERIAVIPIGADSEEIFPKDKQSRFRAEHILDGFVLLYSGNFGRYHNFDILLDAAKKLQTLSRQVTIVLVGNGVQRERIVQRIAQEKIENVRMFPYVDMKDFPDLLASGDVSLVTLEPGIEGMCVPSKFYSILAGGRPTLALMSPGCEVARVVVEERCGIQISLDSVDALVEVICHMASSPSEVEAMGRNARRALTEKYSMNCVAEQYYQTFHTALGYMPLHTTSFPGMASHEEETTAQANN